jgi:hypothetical protein
VQGWTRASSCGVWFSCLLPAASGIFLVHQRQEAFAVRRSSLLLPTLVKRGLTPGGNRRSFSAQVRPESPCRLQRAGCSVQVAACRYTPHPLTQLWRRVSFSSLNPLTFFVSLTERADRMLFRGRIMQGFAGRSLFPRCLEARLSERLTSSRVQSSKVEVKLTEKA